jgi:hypothetical protein
MAAWGSGNFENDDAQDWLNQLSSLGGDDLRPLLARAADNDDYLEAPESSVAVVAAEVVAALNGVPAEAAPRQILDWVNQTEGESSSELTALALRAVQRVRTNSELKDLWLEAEGLNEWSAALRDLEKRLAG